MEYARTRKMQFATHFLFEVFYRNIIIPMKPEPAIKKAGFLLY